MLAGRVKCENRSRCTPEVLYVFMMSLETQITRVRFDNTAEEAAHALALNHLPLLTKLLVPGMP